MMCGVASANEMDGYLRKSTAVPSSGSSGDTNISSDPLGLDRKKLEVNPRIRFNHRGQVAMAFPLDATTTANDTTTTTNNNNDDEEEIAMLRYQFFITLDEAPFLDAKHVAFGTVAGATIFNGLRIGRTDTVDDDDGSGMPAVVNAIVDDPPRIRSVKVDYHPFEDLVITADAKIPWKNHGDYGDDDANGERGKRKEEGKLEKRRKRRKGKRDLNVLSFGDEERGYDDDDDDAVDATATASGKGENKRSGSVMLSSHDVLSNESKFLSSRVDADVDERSKEKERNAKEGSERNTNGANDNERQEASPKTTASSSNNGNVSNTRESSNETRDTRENNTTGRKSSDAPPGSPERDGRSLRRPPKSTEKSNRSEGVVGAVEARRARYLKSGTASSANKKERLKREGDTMARLFAFKNKVIETRGSNGAGGDRDDRDHDDGGTRGEAKRCRADDSLASRMAKRAKRTEDEGDLRDEREAAFAAMPGYSGRVDEDERECERAGDWLGTKFKCKRHVDHDSRRSALDKIGDGMDDVGGDGRRMDDYVVLDEKRSGKGRKNGDGERYHREHGRRNGSGKHAGRSHKSSGRHRPRY